MKTSRKWKLVPWEGNPSLGFKCWRKRFGKGYVYVGDGEFHAIVYSYGPDSDDSMSSTRRRPDGLLTEQQAMDLVDSQGGKAIADGMLTRPALCIECATLKERIRELEGGRRVIAG